MVIRKLCEKDMPAVMSIWLTANVQAHDFIPKSYWKGNSDNVSCLIRQSEVYVYESDGKVIGFVGLCDNYIAGLFVEPHSQSCGVGKRLLDYVKSVKRELSLHVYRDNVRAVRFYKREGFTVMSDGVDGNTGAEEMLMEWKR